MNINFIAFSEKRGGAAKASVRISELFKSNHLKIKFFSIESIGNKIPLRYRLVHFFIWVISFFITKFQRNEKPSKVSLNIFGCGYIRSVVMRSELLHIHWINNETLRIKDFPLLSNKSLITLHDEWFYCGAEHHALDDKAYERVVNGYFKKNKNIRWLDINRYVWNVKRKCYPDLKGVIFTVPSSWMKLRAKNSYLLKDKDIRIVPNPINTTKFKRSDELVVIDGISKDDFVILFGAVDGNASWIKGFDLLTEAIHFFSKKLGSLDKIKIVVFGGKEKRFGEINGIQSIELGHIASETYLSKVYSSATVTIVPSRVESFGQVAAESLSCETPVIAFNHSGLTDIVQHKVSGYLAEPFSPQSLADGILWYYNLDELEKEKIKFNARKHIIENFSEDVVREKFMALYNEIEDKLKNSC
ncbi:glycosyltransferase [Vibrio metschnikovii]|uniref:glycosyltransferase n=1 Tax=Vibrio metschnikovii TaxID=28172 RepID=UPI001C2F3416|nr:glycosyltransferase [Vibrio metschnikovii]